MTTIHGWAASDPTTQFGLEPGTWPEWVAALTTSFAFVVAAMTYARSMKDQRRAQARLVYARIADISHHEPGEEVPGLMNGETMAAPQSDSVTNDLSASGGLTWHAKTRVVRVSVELVNKSDELVLQWLPRLYDYGLKEEYTVLTQPIGYVEPHSSKRVGLIAINPHGVKGYPGLQVNITFQDSTGRLWGRDQFRPIERASLTPEWRRASQR